MRQTIDNNVVCLMPNDREQDRILDWHEEQLRRGSLYDRLTNAPVEYARARACLSFIAAIEYDLLDNDNSLDLEEKNCRFLGFLNGACTEWLTARQLYPHQTGRLVGAYLYCCCGHDPDTVRYLSRAAILLVATDSVLAAIEKGRRYVQDFIAVG